MDPGQFYGLVGSVFGYSDQYGGYHTGVDFPWAEGTPIPMFATGRVAAEGTNVIHGNWVSVMVGSVFFHFCHMRSQSPLDVGQTVNFGDVVGAVGWTGRVIPKSSRGAHLHLAASNGKYPGTGVRVDPLPLVRSHLTKLAATTSVPITEKEENDMKEHLLLEIANQDKSHQWALVSPDLKTFVPIWKTETANNFSKRISEGTSLRSGITEVAKGEWNEFRKAAGLEPDQTVG
jgi:hypothetical protein